MQIVKISTFKGQCSGIIISCNNAREEKHNYYLIITVAHLCKDLFEKIEEKKEQKNIKNYICFDILNTEKNLISEKDYEIEDYFVSESLLNEDDILCFFVKIKDLHHIDGEVMVSDSGSLGDVMTEGFPNISNSQMIDLKGTVCKKTDEINHIYSYRISDDYHYYGTISDLIVMEGLSGAPVLTENNRLLGINQSIPYFSNGENPFKIVNYMDINHIFDFLRENSCIVYSLIDNVLKLKWIKTKNENNKKNISAMVIGGSGAGKSSFISQFIYDNEIIDSSGDGQTTRSDVIYNLSVRNNGRSAQVFFLNDSNGESKDENRSFPLKCFNNIKLELIVFIFKYRYHIPEYDIFNDNYVYFKRIYNFFDMIKQKEELLKKDIEKTLKEFNDFILDNFEKDNNELYERYIDIFVLLDKIKEKIKPQIFRIIINNKLIIDLLDQHEFAKIIPDKDERCMNDFDDSGKIDDDFNELLNKMYDYLRHNIGRYEQIFGKKSKKTIEKYNLTNEQYCKELNKILFYQNGNLEIDEFKFLYRKNKEINPAYISKLELTHIKKIILEDKSNTRKEFNSIEENIKNTYKNIYNEIQIRLVEYFKRNSCLGISINKHGNVDKISSIKFDFNYLTYEGIDLLKYCLKVNDISENRKKSLTAIIDKVEINSMLSNDYAYLADELGLESIIFHDTRGLDHIEKGVDKKTQLRNYLTNIEEGSSMKERIDSVFYIKKLDSGRPTELENTIPFIYDIIPNVPIFCVFTGIDILGYKKNSIIDWYKDKDIRPNSVKYLFSKDINKVFEKLSCSENRKNSVKECLQKNIGAFCAIDNYSSNLFSIKKIIKSILMKEVGSIDIVEQTALIDKLNDDKVNKEVKRLLFIFFSKCVVNWKYAHWRTVSSNAIRIHKKEVLGYWGTYRHRWDLIFNDTYTDVFKDIKYTSSFYKLFENNSGEIEQALINMRENFLGKSQDICSYSDKNKFIKILKKLYRNRENHPFDNKDMQFGNSRDFEAQKYLEEIQNFPKLIKDSQEVLEEFSKLFIDTIRDYLELNREDSLKNIIKYNKILSESGGSLIKEVERLFGKTMSKEDKLKIIMNIIKGI